MSSPSMRKKMQGLESYLSQERLTGSIGEFNFSDLEATRSGYNGKLDLEFEGII